MPVCTVPPVDTEWMRERLEGYLRLCEQYKTAERQSGYDYTEGMREIDRAAEQEFPTLQRILGSLDPDLAHELVGIGYDNSNADRRIRNALDILRDREEWKVRLAPDASSLSADQMHAIPSAREFAVSSGSYGDSVLNHSRKFD